MVVRSYICFTIVNALREPRDREHAFPNPIHHDVPVLRNEKKPLTVLW